MVKNNPIKWILIGMVLQIGPIVFLSAATLAQEGIPNKTIEIMVPYPPGGSTDLLCRGLADVGKKYFGQPIIVANKPGGGTAIGTAYVFNSKPDGYTLGIVASATHILRPYFFKVSYDVLKFTPVIQVAGYPMTLVVRKDAPWNSFQELLDYAQKNPGRIKFTTAAAYCINHLTMEAIARKKGIKWDRVPSTGEATAIPMLLGGHIDFYSGGGSWLPHVQAGTLKPLVTFGEKMFPDVPTLTELGYNFPTESSAIIIGPPGIPDPIVRRLHDGFKMAMAEPSFEESRQRINLLKSYRSSEELKKQLLSMYMVWGDFIRDLDIKRKE